MKKLNITKKHYMESKYFQRKYGKLEYISESGKLFKTDKGKVLKFVKESSYESLQEFYDWLKSNTELDSGIHVRYHDNEDGTESLEMTFDDRFDWGDDVDDGVIPKEQSENYQEWLQMFKSKAKENGWEFKKDYDDTYDEYVLILISVGSQEDYYESKRFGNKFVGESDEGRWSEYGEFLGQLPMECIVDCSHSGKCDSDVEYWTDQLAFADGLPLDKAIEFIAEYGAWDREELSQKSPEEIAQIVLWIFCGNLKDEAYQFMRDGDSEDWPDLEDWDEKDWRRFQEEQCFLGLNN
jgi:hypothetical protein